MPYVQKSIIFLCIFFILLNPYTVIGRPGILISLIFTFYAVYNRNFFLGWLNKITIFHGLLFYIALIGAISSFYHDILQLNHLLAVVSLLAVFLTSAGIWKYCQTNKINTDIILLFAFASVVLNSIIILFQLNFEVFRTVVESFLIEAGNIDYTKGFRYRGLSASGGAGLSILIAAAVPFAFFIFYKKLITIYTLIISIIILFSSCLVVGRTGILLAPIGAIVIIFMHNLQKISISNFIYLIVITLSIILIAPFVHKEISIYLTDKFGEGFMNYAFDFILKGKDGFETEGTVNVIQDFLTVLPSTFPEILIGYGFYGGSDFHPWTDSGYSRMFLSIGFPLGIIFYVLIFRLYLQEVSADNKKLLTAILTILIIAEAKESLLFSGNASRLFVLILVFFVLDHKAKMKEKNHT
jgi:hypothetical protein